MYHFDIPHRPTQIGVASQRNGKTKTLIKRENKQIQTLNLFDENK